MHRPALRFADPAKQRHTLRCDMRAEIRPSLWAGVGEILEKFLRGGGFILPQQPSAQGSCVTVLHRLPGLHSALHDSPQTRSSAVCTEDAARIGAIVARDGLLRCRTCGLCVGRFDETLTCKRVRSCYA